MSHNEQLHELQRQIARVTQVLDDMTHDSKLETLFSEFHACGDSMDEEVREANDAFDRLTCAKRDLARLNSDLAEYEAMAIIAEMHKEGFINGSNAEKRKFQMAAFAAHLREHDQAYHNAWAAVKTEELAVDDATVTYEQAKNVLGALRGRARMIAGLANAMGG